MTTDCITGPSISIWADDLTDTFSIERHPKLHLSNTTQAIFEDILEGVSSNLDPTSPFSLTVADNMFREPDTSSPMPVPHLGYLTPPSRFYRPLPLHGCDELATSASTGASSTCELSELPLIGPGHKGPPCPLKVYITVPSHCQFISRFKFSRLVSYTHLRQHE